MALNGWDTTQDFVRKTAESRQIAKTFGGDFLFDQYRQYHRHKIFLPRNMTKVLAFHEKNRGSFASSSSRTRGPYLGNSMVTGKAAINGTPTGDAADHRNFEPDRVDPQQSKDSAMTKPDVESMSPDCLKVKARAGSLDDDSREKRRSMRHQQARQYDDHNAQLYFELSNIRKKLNFKENTLDIDDRPRKRLKRESVRCHCHITIWDNREGLDQREPIVRKSELCDITTSEQGPAGIFAEIELQNPFVFKSSELQVPLSTPNGTVLGIGDKYFLEIKIIPTRTDVDWPPVPVLGRSEGDQSTNLGRMAAEKLQGALVARYLHLPQAPAPDVPLSVFFLHEGRTYRSKYGLEVNSMWSTWEKQPPAGLRVKHEEDHETTKLWTVDEEGRAFGARDKPKVKTTPTASDTKAGMRHTDTPGSVVKVTYNIDVAIAKGIKDFRKCTVTGLRCPSCDTQDFDTLEKLQFHFMTIHPKYKFVVDKQEFRAPSNDLSSVTFKIVAVNPARSRHQTRENRKSDKDLNWQAPQEPLNIPDYVNGDQRWVEQNWSEGLSKKSEPAAAIQAVVLDPVSAIRQQQYNGFLPGQKGGFLPAEQVTDFRKSDRKRFPNVQLKTMTPDKATMYTSISHRPVERGEDARSETDDEMEDGWFIEKSLEALDITAEKEGWNEDERLLRRRWNNARLREKLSHPRYLSDCLIRFVRAEKSWLNSGGSQREAAYVELISELLQRRVINEEVIRDLWMILDNDDDRVEPVRNRVKPTTDTPVHEAPVVQTLYSTNLDQHSIPQSRKEQAEIWFSLPQYSCGVCARPIEEMGRCDVRCSELDCEAPGIWFHPKCVRCKRKDKLNWKCRLCHERLSEMTKMKSKEMVTS